MWIAPKSLSAAFVLESECSTSQSRSDLKKWACEAARLFTLSGKHSPARFWVTAVNRKPWMQRLFTRALPDSMDGPFADWWTSSLRACRANPTALPESVRGTLIVAASEKVTGQSSTRCGSSRKLSLPWCSSKTSQPGLPLGISGSDQSAKDFQTWVIESRSRSSSLRAMLARATNGSEFSYSRTDWMTPLSESSESGGGNQTQLWRQAEKMWPTARAEDSESCGTHPGSKGGDSLTGMLKNWPTPDANAMERTNRSPSEGAATRPTIALAAKNWKTPHGMAGIDHSGKVGGGGEFAKQVEAWATPQAMMAPTCNAEAARNSPSLEHQAVSRLWARPAAHNAHGAASAGTGDSRHRDLVRENSLQHMNLTDGRTDGRTEQESCRPTSEFRDGELFAPGPSDPRWGAIVAARPWLAPATKSGVRVLADGAPAPLDASRRDQLRAVGNGAVPLCASLAFVILAREAGMNRAQFADQVSEVAA